MKRFERNNGNMKIMEGEFEENHQATSFTGIFPMSLFSLALVHQLRRLETF